MLSPEELEKLLPFKPGDKVSYAYDVDSSIEYIVVSPCSCITDCGGIVVKSTDPTLKGLTLTLFKNVLKLIEDQIGKCIKCGTLNEYQSGPFTCWSCK
jgi:hypothetical protein